MAKFDITKFAEALPDRADLPDSGMTREIPVDDILDNPRNFYPRPDNQALAALMESIQANGLLEPPTVVPDTDGKYRLISGHSRMAALRLLAANRDEAVAKQFSTVLCRVLPAMTEEQELCAVIEANRQRVKSNALLAQEAEKLKETYIRRKKAGEAFPVGLRDWIAKEMRINATKVGNLQVIKKGLKVPGIIARWESGELPEAAALEIARMDDETQYRLLDWMIDNGRSYSIKDVQEFVKSREAGAQASEDEKYIELLTYMRDSLEQTLRDCADRQAGILALKTRFRWAGGGSSEGGFNGTSKGLALYGEDGKRILRPWATVWDMLAAMRLQDGPAPSSKAAKAPRETVEPRCGEGETPLSLVWHESGVKPPEGAHIVFIDENGVADEDVYVSGRLESGWADWEEVVLWTLYPDDPAQPEAASAPEWLPLDAEHWPTEGALVALSYETGLGGSSYLVARCAGSADEAYPFIPTDAGTTVDEIIECRCDRWMPLAECGRGKEGA